MAAQMKIGATIAANWASKELSPVARSASLVRLSYVIAGLAPIGTDLGAHQASPIVMPAKAGIQGRAILAALDPRFRGGDIGKCTEG
jgi:hypothetical protein